MAAPQVQDLTDLINQYKTTLAPQQAILDTSIAANDTSGQQQIQGIDAQKTTAFKGITQSANDRGGYFSGFSPDQEATYTAGTYLPALAQLQGTIASTRASLLGKKADLDTTASQSALGTRQQQQSALQTWQNQQDQLAAQAAEAEKTRQFTAGQSALDRAASVAAASRAAANAAAAKPAQYTWAKNGSGGYNVVGSDGKAAKVDLATAVASQGGGLTNLVSLLLQGSASDKKAAQQYQKDGDYNKLVNSTGAFYTGGGF